MKLVIHLSFYGLLLALIAFGVLNYVDLLIGDVIDWAIGIISFIWLTTIVVVPWNAHFKAREVLDDAEISQRKDILVIDSSLGYVRKVAQHSLYLAIALHLISALILYFVAYLDVSPVGYFGAIAAVLLTFFRPAVRFYEYLQKRLGDIRQEFRYPRQDLHELLKDFKTMKAQIGALETTLETDPEKPSWRQEVEKNHQDLNKQLADFKDEEAQNHQDLILQLKAIEQLIETFKTNTSERFAKVSEEGKQRVEKLIADNKILESVRTLAGFVKEVRG